LSPLGEKLSIQVDGDAIYNALFNLVTNAFDAFDSEDKGGGKNSENKGGKTARKVMVSVSKEPGWIVYRVRDNGGGMDENIRKALFKEFITTKGARGTGFGLMTTKKIVDEHNGLISFETRKGEGTVFAMRIPLEPPLVKEGEYG